MREMVACGKRVRREDSGDAEGGWAWHFGGMMMTL